MALIRFKRGTRAQLDAAAAASQLNAGEPYYLTDEEAYAIGTSATTYVDVGPADTAFATEGIFVDVNGNDTTGDGTPGRPYATLQKGIDEATSGEAVIVSGACDFAENVTCKDGVDVVAPMADLTLNDGNRLTLASGRVIFRRLIRTSGTGAMVIAANTGSYAILTAFEINDTGSGNTIQSSNDAPADIQFSQAYVGTGQSLLIDESSARHTHIAGEDIYLIAIGSKAVTITAGSTVLMQVHHIKELAAGIGECTIFDIIDGDINVACQEIGAATLANIGADGRLNIKSQEASGAVNNSGGVYSYMYTEFGGDTRIGTDLSLRLDAASYVLEGLAGNPGAFLTLGANGALVPATINVGSAAWEDTTPAFTDVDTTTEEVVYSVTVDQDFDAGSVEYEVTLTYPYYRTHTVRLYQGATLLDTQTFEGSATPLTFTGVVALTAAVTSGDIFTVTLQTDEAPGFEPNRSDITGGFLLVTKTGANATAEWGSITGDITTQTDLIDTFLARNNTDVYTPSALYHPATKKYVDDLEATLGTAATTDSTAYATSDQGDKADTAHGWGDHSTEGYAKTAADVGLGNVDNVSAADLRDRSTHTGTQPHTTITGLGTAATTDASAYATAAQGSTADTAVQPGDLGTAASEDVTTSATDTTAGRLLKVGDFGVGANAPPFYPFSNLDDANSGGGSSIGFYRLAGTETGLPSGWSGIGILNQTAYSAAAVQQEVIMRSNPTRMWRRMSLPGSLWSPWQELYHTGNTIVDGNGFIKEA